MDNESKSAITFLSAVGYVEQQLREIAVRARKHPNVASVSVSVSSWPGSEYPHSEYPSIEGYASVSFESGAIFDWLINIQIYEANWLIDFGIHEGTERGSEAITDFQDVVASTLEECVAGLKHAADQLVASAIGFDFSDK